MFKWRKNKNTPTYYEPKTPVLPKLSLPDDRYVPISFGPSHSEQLPTSLLLRFTPERRSTTPAYEKDKGHHRSRTLSTPVGAREVKAPRPIRPHPSQGPYVPAENALDVYAGIVRGPVAVPSAQYLEEQIRKNPPPIMMRAPDAEYERLKRVAQSQGTTCVTVPSKAYKEHQQEVQDELEARLKDPMAPILRKEPPESEKKGILNFDKWKPVPVERDNPGRKHGPDLKAPGGLKSALKKTAVQKTPKIPLKSAMKKSAAADSGKGYQSENEAVTRSYDRNGNPIKISTVVSKAYLEEQQERLEQEKNHRRSTHNIPAPIPVMPATRGFIPPPEPAHRPPTSTMRPVLQRSSSATPSPVERYYVHDRSYGFPQEDLPWHDHVYDARYTSHYEGLQQPHRIHVKLSWPLVDYETRKRLSPRMPRLYFDAAFDPRSYPVKTIQGYGIAEPLREPEETGLGVAENCYVGRMRIICRYLPLWEVEVKAPHGLRVIDVFRAIYNTYSHPLTRDEINTIGSEYLEKCRKSFLQRCEDSPGLTYLEERKGMLRIDTMRGRRRFKGLVPIHGKPDYYELIFDDTPIETRRR